MELLPNKLQHKKGMTAIPSIYEYTSYKTFLSDYYEQHKSYNPRFTLSEWAQKIKTGNTATLSRLLDGSRLPGPQLIQQLILYFQFDERSQEYFRYLVLLEKNKEDAEMRLLITEKLAQLSPKKKFQRLDHQTFMAISNWHYFAIREMILLKDFEEDGAWISEKLLFRITAAEAKKALAILLDLGLISRDEKTGKLFQKDLFVDWKSDVVSEASKRNHEQNLDNAKIALREVQIDLREFNAVCMNVAKSDVAKMKQFIQDFKNQFIQKFENHDNAEATYQMQIQLFPFTKE